MRRLFVSLALLLAGLNCFSGDAVAKIGVGVNTGIIQVDEKLKAGMIYKLPPITVINTGDEPSDYGTSIAYHQSQPRLRPKQDWFIFTPQQFHLEPGKGQLVEIKINLPLKIEPGDYFAYLEGHPIAIAKKGTTTIGVAAAAKLYFTVIPANPLQGIYYKVISFFKVYAPWPQRVTIAILIVGLLVLFKKFFNIKVNFKKPADKKPIDDKKNE